MFITTAWTGDSQAGSFPAWCSIRMVMNRSSEPKIARWSMTGVLFLAVLVDVMGAQPAGHVQVHLEGAALLPARAR